MGGALVIVCCGHWRRVIDLIPWAKSIEAPSKVHGVSKRRRCRITNRSDVSEILILQTEALSEGAKIPRAPPPPPRLPPPYMASTFLTPPIHKLVYERCEGSHVSACAVCAFV